jgi:hypothetical protein
MKNVIARVHRWTFTRLSPLSRSLSLSSSISMTSSVSTRFPFDPPPPRFTQMELPLPRSRKLVKQE